jgi:hypothetical protein
MCSGCRAVVYCSLECHHAHYAGHKEACYVAISARMLAGDVHKDDSGGEYVLKDWLDECTGAHGELHAQTFRNFEHFGAVFWWSLEGWGLQRL